jgi:hypothetical protein
MKIELSVTNAERSNYISLAKNVGFKDICPTPPKYKYPDNPGLISSQNSGFNIRFFNWRDKLRMYCTDNTPSGLLTETQKIYDDFNIIKQERTGGTIKALQTKYAKPKN